MTRDFAKSSRGHNHGESRIPTWVWFLTGFVSGFFVAFLFYLDGWVETDPEASLPVITQSDKSPLNEKKIQEIELDFYEIFPKMEVPVVEEFNKDGIKVSVEDTATYILQAGSFSKKEDAEKMRARLLLLGLEVFLGEGEKDGRKTHRVFVGPPMESADLENVRKLLDGEQINHFPLRVKN